MKVLMWVTMVALLTGCAVRPPAPLEGDTRVLDVAEWAAPARPQHWTLNGRAALKTSEEAGSASVRWTQSAVEYQLTLRGTLGAGNVDLQRNPDGVILQTGDGSTYVADSARELLRAVTGVDWPVEILRFWVTGHAAPWLPGQVRVDEAGQLIELRQNGWVIQYDRYQRIDGYQLPGRIWAESRHSSLRLAVRDWSVEP